MKSTRDARVLFKLVCSISTLSLATAILHGLAPSWWESKQVYRYDSPGVVAEANDFAAANQGQLKNIALAAYENLIEKLERPGLSPILGGIGDMTPPASNQPIGPNNQGGTGWRLVKLVSTWVEVDYDFATNTGSKKVIRRKMNGTVPQEPEAWGPDGTGPRKLTVAAQSHDDFKAINQGQLKAVAAPFYDRMNEIYRRPNGTIFATGAYGRPWSDIKTDDSNHALVNLGQLKNVFSLDGDRDHDGKSDIDEVASNLSLPPGGVIIDPGNPDSDEDGIPDGAETGDNAHTADSDGDGINDGEDNWVDDATRSEPIPMKHYAAINLSDYLPASIKDDFEATDLMAINDNNQVSFYGQTHVGNGSYWGHVLVWKDGAMQSHQKHLLRWDATAETTPWIGFPSTVPSPINITGRFIIPRCINADGTLFGVANEEIRHMTYITPEGDYGENSAPITKKGVFSFTASGSLTFNASPPPEFATYDHEFNDLLGPHTANGSALLSIEEIQEPNSAPPHFHTVATPGGLIHAGHSRVLPLSGSILAPDNSYVFLEYGENSEPPTWHYYNHPLEAVYSIPEGVTQLTVSNGATHLHQAIGNDSNGPFLADETAPGQWQKIKLKDLLRWTGKPSGTKDDYEKYFSRPAGIESHIQSFTARFITTPDPASAGITIETRTFANGVPKTIFCNGLEKIRDYSSTENEEVSTQREYVMELKATSDTPAKRYFTLGAVTTSLASGKPIIVTANNSGAALANVEEQGFGVTSLRFLIPYEFTVDTTGNPSALHKGLAAFDPPMTNDPTPGSVTTGAYAESDNENPEVFWTSVCSTNTTRAADWMENSQYPNLQLNKHIRLQFGALQNGGEFKLRVKPEHQAYIKIGTSEETLGSEINTLSQVNQLVIKGLSIGEADVDLIPKNASPANACATLKVMILPEHRLKLDISLIDLWWTQPELNNVNTDALLRAICEFHAQSCVTFERANSTTANANKIPISIYYDKYLPRNSFNYEHQIEYNAVNSAIQDDPTRRDADINLCIFGNINVAGGENGILYGVSRPLIRLTAISYDAHFKAVDPAIQPADKQSAFQFTCAHEIGHILNLSSRTNKIKSSHFANQNGMIVLRQNQNEDRHDPGPFPHWLGIHNSLMSSGDYIGAKKMLFDGARRGGWLRHEDWARANTAAYEGAIKRN